HCYTTAHSHFLRLPRRRPRRAPLFPYTTLFRSMCGATMASDCVFRIDHVKAPNTARAMRTPPQLNPRSFPTSRRVRRIVKTISRSEEHTSELQSRFDLVCRLLLEKKKDK